MPFTVDEKYLVAVVSSDAEMKSVSSIHYYSVPAFDFLANKNLSKFTFVKADEKVKVYIYQ